MAYHLFLDTMVGLATVNQPDGTIAVLLFSAVAAVVVGALVGRTAAGAVGAPKERTSRIARAGVRNYVVAAIGIATALGALSTFLGGHFQWGLVFALVYGPIGAVVLLPLAIAPLVAAALLLERWTRPDCAAKTTSNNRDAALPARCVGCPAEHVRNGPVSSGSLDVDDLGTAASAA